VERRGNRWAARVGAALRDINDSSGVVFITGTPYYWSALPAEAHAPQARALAEYRRFSDTLGVLIREIPDDRLAQFRDDAALVIRFISRDASSCETPKRVLDEAVGALRRQVDLMDGLYSASGNTMLVPDTNALYWNTALDTVGNSTTTKAPDAHGNRQSRSASCATSPTPSSSRATTSTRSPHAVGAARRRVSSWPACFSTRRTSSSSTSRPTYLDLATKEMLLEALHEFEGTMLFVSHDRSCEGTRQPRAGARRRERHRGAAARVSRHLRGKRRAHRPRSAGCTSLRRTEDGLREAWSVQIE
jgi:hypothetical protein